MLSNNFLVKHSYVIMGRDSSVGIATRYGLDGPGIESRGGDEIFRTSPDRTWVSIQPPVQWVQDLSRG